MGNMWHVKNWFRVGHNISWSLNFHTLFGFLYLSHPCSFFYKESQRKHEFVLSYLRKELAPTIEHYRKITETSACLPKERIIWVVWWQGEDNAPPLVKACINSICRNANGAEVNIVTRENLSSYVDIPEYIFEKYNKGFICNAVLSDIARFALLEKYGGLWLDATIYVSQPIPPVYFQYPFFSLHTLPQKRTAWVQNNAYHIFVIGSQDHGKLVSFAKTMFFEYWKTHDTAVDYLCTDYFFYLAMQEYPDIKQEIDSLPFSSERLYDLVGLLNKPFDKEEFEKLSADCIFSKLDWHKKYKTTVDKQPTYFSAIVDTENQI